jgi:DNA-binding helix-hairpin-helix protein with protein kinase domain
MLAPTPNLAASSASCSRELIVHDLLGGEVLLAQVLLPGGSRQGVHYWNRLPNGYEVDLTVGQFTEGEQVQQGRIVSRPLSPPRRCHEQFTLLRERVLACLGELE